MHAVKQIRTPNAYLNKSNRVEEGNGIFIYCLLVMFIGNALSYLWLTKWRDVYIFLAEVNGSNADALIFRYPY
ncbi:hypothetical protein ALTERO38_60773 [Alteromonas sp. 38]|nr:hypothetical protein ALTER154_40022 [Alteromonas sp. 154]VXC33139.1 hypothetical protein ALTERO38_60773 [Alteromonas sp. 38]